MSFYAELFGALNEAGARYLVAGGVAVVLHGHARLTLDVDMVVDFEPDEARKVIDVLSGIGLVPRAPVDPQGFADPSIRTAWVHNKNMRVFSMIDAQDPHRVVDLFVEDPAPFSELWQRSVVMDANAVTIRVVGLEDLIAMKETAGREKDRADLEALRDIARGGSVSDWPVTYEANERAQRLDVAHAAPGQRLAWLEDAQALSAARRIRR